MKQLTGAATKLQYYDMTVLDFDDMERINDIMLLYCKNKDTDAVFKIRPYFTDYRPACRYEEFVKKLSAFITEKEYVFFCNNEKENIEISGLIFRSPKNKKQLALFYVSDNGARYVDIVDIHRITLPEIIKNEDALWYCAEIDKAPLDIALERESRSLMEAFCVQ